MSVLILTYTSSTSTSVLLNYTGGGTVVTPRLLVNAREYLNYVSDTSTITVSGLSPNTLYSFQWSTDEFVVSNLVNASTSVTPIPTTPVLLLGSLGPQFVSLPFSGAIGSTSYAVFVNGVEDSNAIVVGSSALLYGLSPSTTYDVQLEAINSTGSAFSRHLSVTTPAIPTPPSALTIAFTSATSTTLTFSFTGGLGATSYIAYINDFQVPSANLSVVGSSFTISGLVADTPYLVYLQALNDVGSTDSNGQSVSTIAAASSPTKPVIVSVSATEETLTFSYTGGDGATSFSATADGNPVAPGDLSFLGNQFTISGLTDSTTYAVILIATNSSGSTPSDPVDGTTLTPPPPPTSPLVISGSTITDTSLYFNFTGGVGATSYSATTNGSAVPTLNLIVTTSGSSFFQITGLTPSTSYAVIFTATNSSGSVTSNTVTRSTGSTPTAPTQPVITFSSATTTSVTFTYTGGVGATSYSATTDAIPVAPGDLNTSTPGTFIISGLTDGTTYAVVFTATNTIGSTSSAPVNGTTSSTPTAPTQPVITFDSATTTTLTFAFTGGVGATSYSATANGTPVVSGDLSVTSPTFTISGLTAGTMYAVVFTATNVTGSTSSAPPVDGTTASTVTVPTLLVLTFFLSPSSGSYVLNSTGNLKIGYWDLVAGTITDATGGAAAVISYLTGLKAAGCKILLSIGGATANLPLLFGGTTQPVDLARSMAYSLFDVSASPNPLNFQKTDWSTFVFDGLDYDIEANTPTESDLATFHLEFKTQVPNSIVIAAPQSPNVITANPNGLNANGNYGIISSIPTAVNIDLTTAYNNTNYAAILNQSVLSTMDYLFIQCYNNTNWYYTDPYTQTFVNMLASYGYACLKASPEKCKIVIGLASADGIPIFDPATSALLNTCISDANAIIADANGPTNISDWLSGVGMWNSPSNITAITSIYSNNALSNIPANVTILYCNASGTAPGWVAGTNVPIPVSR